MNTNANTNSANTHTTTKELTQQLEHQVWQLRVECYSENQIATELNLSQTVVSRILNRIRTRLAEELANGAAKRLAEQVEQLMHIANEALAEWKQSKQETAPPPTQEIPQESPAQPDPTQNTAQSPEAPPKKQPAKPAYLRIAIQALAAVRSIFALNRSDPSEPAPYNDNVKMIVGIDLDHMKYKDGTLAPRKEVDRILAQQQ